MKKYNKFQNLNYSFDQKPMKEELIIDCDQSSVKYGEDFLDIEIKSPELKRFKDDIDLTKINNSMKMNSSIYNSLNSIHKSIIAILTIKATTF